MFDRGQLCGQDGLLGVVISAHRRHQAIDQEKLAAQVRAELLAAFPGLPTPLWTKVIAENRATFACTVGVKRPDNALPCRISIWPAITQMSPIPPRWNPRFAAALHVLA